MAPQQLTGAIFCVIFIPVMTWQGLNLIVNPKQWLERHGRSTADTHIRACRLIGWMFLALVLLTVFQLIQLIWRRTG
jgi:hypothetical protein